MRSLLLLPIVVLVAACAATADDDVRVQTKVGLHPSEICDNGPNECENGDNGGGGGAPDPVCGDGRCNGTETCTSCPGDCGECSCGDGACDGAENCASCPKDCGNCPPPTEDRPPNGDVLEDPKSELDLVPIVSDDSCPRVKGDNLAVRIKNTGQQGAGATVTRVVFSMANGVVDLPTGPIAAGDTATLITQMPTECIDAEGSCSFSITADAQLTVVESNESNNYVTSACTLPK